MSVPLEKLAIRGGLTENAPLGAQSWFRCGGTADLFFEPADFDDLKVFLEQYPAGAPLMVLGGMANCIIRDGGIRGCVIRLGKAFADIEVEGDRIIVGAGALNGSVSSAAAKAGLGGLEFLSGVPGTIGGAVRMNAGAYGSEVKDVLVEVTAIDRSGQTHVLKPADLKMRYRHTELPEGHIFVSAVFKGQIEEESLVRERLKEIKAKRQETQPITESTGGSTFANPSAEELQVAGLPEGTRAWQLIDKVGGRGFQIGGAQMSEKHCNFMINTGDATASNLEDLGEEMRRRVQEEFGLELHWEIKRLGDH